MNRIRLLGMCAALGGIAVLGGCVAYPVGPAYDGGAVYSDPYYVNPGPVYAAPPSVYIEGGYGGGYYGPRYYNRPGYYGRPDYDGRRGYEGPRPGDRARRPGTGVPPVARGAEPPGGGIAPEAIMQPRGTRAIPPPRAPRPDPGQGPGQQGGGGGGGGEPPPAIMRPR